MNRDLFKHFFKHFLQIFMGDRGILPASLYSNWYPELLILLYHQIISPELLKNPCELEKALEIFSKHLEALKSKPILHPGDALTPSEFHFALTFDDAYADFYHCIFPLLKKYKIKAILGIPTAYIQDPPTDQLPNPHIRLNTPYPEGLNPRYCNQVPLCTWTELKEMQDSGLVYMASHGHQHLSCTEINETRLKQELETSKKLILEKLGFETQTFIYPYGHCNAAVHTVVRQFYNYAFRIGSASNTYWDNAVNNHLLYRVHGDDFYQEPRSPLLVIKSQFKFWAWRCKYFTNLLRNK
ncbi:MAG: polysaccharide deacetylase family protein [Gammaproteobacteria bacterium]